MGAFSWDNYVDDATITNSTPGWLASPNTSTEVISVSKLQTRQPSDIFRQTFTATSPEQSLIIDFNLGSAKEVDVIGILNHNMAGMTYTIDFGTTAGASDVGTETGTFWTGTANDAKNEMIFLSTSLTAQHVRLTVSVNASPVSIGRVWLDKGWSLSCSMDYRLGVRDDSTVTETIAGSVFATTRKRRRFIECDAHGLQTSDIIGTDAATASFLSADLAIGQHGECIVFPDTSAKRQLQMMGIYGHLTRNEPIQFIDKGANGFIARKRFTVLEDF